MKNNQFSVINNINVNITNIEEDMNMRNYIELVSNPNTSSDELRNILRTAINVLCIEEKDSAEYRILAYRVLCHPNADNWLFSFDSEDFDIPADFYFSDIYDKDVVSFLLTFDPTAEEIAFVRKVVFSNHNENFDECFDDESISTLVKASNIDALFELYLDYLNFIGESGDVDNATLFINAGVKLEIAQKYHDLYCYGQDGYDQFGYDHEGFNRDGIDEYGYTKADYGDDCDEDDDEDYDDDYDDYDVDELCEMAWIDTLER